MGESSRIQVDVESAKLREIVDTTGTLEQLVTGFAFTEGPAWHPGHHELIFSDMPGDCMRRYTVDRGIEVFRHPSNMANGNTWDRDGSLVTCEHATSRVVRAKKDGSLEIMASHFNGKELNSPNDIIVKRDGFIYFTDPDFGRREYFGVKRDKDLEFQGVYRVGPGGGDVELLSKELQQPNGLAFSMDESLLYVADTPAETIHVFDVLPDGVIAGMRPFAEVKGDGKGRPDGLKVDIDGHVFCAGPGGIHVFDAAGTFLGRVRIPEHTSNFTWGGEDMMDVFVTASTSLYRFRARVPGPVLF